MSDSRPETYEHIRTVRENLDKIIIALLQRAEEHDQSKLLAPELAGFDKATGQLRGLTYGSEAYKAQLAQVDLKDTVQHHYKHNRHHPEYFHQGIRGMNLVDLVEMLADWEAATHRHNDGNIALSIELNQDRFGYSDELKEILLNTAQDFGWVPSKARGET